MKPVAGRLADRIMGNLPRTLFLRAFLAFWLAFVLIVAAGLGVTALVANARGDALDDVDPAALVQQARLAASEDGEAGLGRWIRRAESAHDTLNVYVFNRQRHDLLGRTPPRRVQHWMETYMDHRESGRLPVNMSHLESPALFQPAESGHDSGTDADADAGAGAGTGLARERMSWWEVHEIVLPDGQRYLLRFLPFDSSRLEVLGAAYVPLLLLLVTLIMSAPVCWLLALYVSNPVRHLEQGAHAIGEGDLDIHVNGELLQRRDEVGALARAFEQMAQRLRTMIASKENLLRDVSHELRSPLTRLRMALELARLPGADTPAQLERMEQECLRLDGMVGQLLLLARLRNAPDDMPAPVDMAELVADVGADAAFEARALDRRVEMAIAPREQLVLGVPALLTSALENVVRNALRFTPPGSSVELSTLVEVDMLEISVRDHGPGASEADLPLLFDPFYRGSSASHADGGAGLGLAIAQAILARHGGTIVAENAESAGGGKSVKAASDIAGGGLLVRLRLPLLQGQATGVETVGAGAADTGAAGTGAGAVTAAAAPLPDNREKRARAS